jgi:hypothetical protein
MLVDRREKRAANSRWSTQPPVSAFPESQTEHREENDIPSHHKHLTPSSCREDGILSCHNLSTSAQIFLRSDREIVLWSHYFDHFLPANILPRAYSRFSSLDVGDVPELRYCMLACSSIQAANRACKPPGEALFYYTRTITGLRRKLASNTITGQEDWVFVVMILCHCFEVCDILFIPTMLICNRHGAVTSSQRTKVVSNIFLERYNSYIYAVHVLIHLSIVTFSYS